MCFIAVTDSQPNSTSWSTYLSLSCLCCGWLLGQTGRWGCSELHYKEWVADGSKLIDLSELSCGAPACSSERQALQPVADYVSAVRETISLLSSFCWFQKSKSTLGFNGLSAQFLLFSFSFVGVALVNLLHSVFACPLQRTQSTRTVFPGPRLLMIGTSGFLSFSITDSTEWKSLHMCLCEESGSWTPRGRTVAWFKAFFGILDTNFAATSSSHKVPKVERIIFFITLPAVCYHTKNCSQFYGCYAVVGLNCLSF